MCFSEQKGQETVVYPFMEHSSAFRRDKLLKYGAMCMDLKDIVLSERESQFI